MCQIAFNTIIEPGQLKPPLPMAFNSLFFIFLFAPLFFLVYFAAPTSSRNAVCLGFSLIFYAWAEPLFIFVVAASSALDHVLVLAMARSRSDRMKSLLAALAIGQGLSLLLYFKYAAFLYGAVASIVGINPAPPGYLSPLLPLAISFVTFEKITYVVDNFRGDGKPARTFLDYLTYVFLFPKLIAGPIVKYREVEPYLGDRPVRTEDFQNGLLRFALGLAKKVLIADTLGATADAAFAASPMSLNSADAWLGIVCFTFQIYFDFSGYSDMAIGLARMMGFPLRENFNQPYRAINFTDFWHRWHISLSTWIRDYLYIPLGGNRVAAWRVYFNLVICFVLSGLWHGANWTFLLWGVFHGIFLVADRAGLARITRRLPAVINIATTFLLVMLSWVLFRSPNIAHAVGYLHAMFDPGRDLPPLVFLDQRAIITLTIAAMMSFIPVAILDPKAGYGQFSRFAQAASAAVIAIAFLWATGRVAGATFTPFLYFRF
jgi:alginate O-acetyltransferase complex protein AlgI